MYKKSEFSCHYERVDTTTPFASTGIPIIRLYRSVGFVAVLKKLRGFNVQDPTSFKSRTTGPTLEHLLYLILKILFRDVHSSTASVDEFTSQFTTHVKGTMHWSRSS